MRIAFLCNGLFPYVVGGMQKHSVNLLRGLANEGLEVVVFYIETPAYPPEDTIREELFQRSDKILLQPVVAPHFPYFPGHYYPERYLRSREFWRSLNKRLCEFDFIYSQGYPGWETVRQGKRRQIPIGVNFHGLEALQGPQTLTRSLSTCFAAKWLRWNLKNADSVFSLGGRLNDLIKSCGVPPRHIHPSKNGIAEEWLAASNTKDWSRSTNDVPIRFLFVGRDEKRKGIRELNDAITFLRKSYVFEMHFVGAISEPKRLNLPNVFYHGQVTDQEELRAIYGMCDILVCPSHAEGAPTVILEAMATGLAVIATDVGAVSEVVSEGNGWLIAPHSIHQLTTAMTKCFGGDLTEKKMASLSVANQYSWKTIAKETVDSINRSIKNYQEDNISQ